MPTPQTRLVWWANILSIWVVYRSCMESATRLLQCLLQTSHIRKSFETSQSRLVSLVSQGLPKGYLKLARDQRTFQRHGYLSISPIRTPVCTKRRRGQVIHVEFPTPGYIPISHCATMNPTTGHIKTLSLPSSTQRHLPTRRAPQPQCSSQTKILPSALNPPPPLQCLTTKISLLTLLSAV